MTVTDVCNVTNLSRYTVMKHVQLRTLSAIKRGRWYISPAECLRWSRWLWANSPAHFLPGPEGMYPPDWIERNIKNFGLR